MPNTAAPQKLAEARRVLARPQSFDDFMGKLSMKDRMNVERRVTVLDSNPDPRPARLWERLTCTLVTLAPHAVKLVGRQTVQFYIADGKYRMQVFALEDLQDGNFTVYCPDAIEDAVSAGLLAPPPHPGDPMYTIEATGEPLKVEPLDAKSLNPGAHYKDLTGWNRKALRITLPPSASPPQIEAAELLCALAAGRFVSSPAPVIEAKATKR